MSRSDKAFSHPSLLRRMAARPSRATKFQPAVRYSPLRELFLKKQGENEMVARASGSLVLTPA
ncbi:hypothetical protein L0Y69_01460, partial [bacterium]|nr:hypothetical protein [bacterium]